MLWHEKQGKRHKSKTFVVPIVPWMSIFGMKWYFISSFTMMHIYHNSTFQLFMLIKNNQIEKIIHYSLWKIYIITNHTSVPYNAQDNKYYTVTSHSKMKKHLPRVKELSYKWQKKRMLNISTNAYWNQNHHSMNQYDFSSRWEVLRGLSRCWGWPYRNYFMEIRYDLRKRLIMGFTIYLIIQSSYSFIPLYPLLK